ncbi:DUF6716 putative glycosyltransferase [Aeromicrobium sp. CTD01-1L150]|uniref:DUF6716 putative glycosyltransferase n=1 Tax=Aeromicrobium sp. CTD01-1L150 TaxID=3341830 RepID=UPI0035BFD19E
MPPAVPPAAAPTALVVAAFDSQLKWASAIWSELRSRGFACRVAAPRTMATLSQEQIAATGVDHVELVAADELVDVALEHDVVVNALSGPFVHDFTLELAERGGDGPGPVVVAGWVGVIIEKLTAGYLDRSAADVVAVNAQHELQHFAGVARRLGIGTDNLLLSGLPILSTSPRPQDTGPIRTVLFADQPTVPNGPVERLHLYRRLVDHARRHPERTVLLKPRHRRGEGTFHRMHHHPQDLLADDDLPANVEFTHRPVPDLLEEVDLLLTMSSTACLEAVDRGRRVALVLDLGVHERHGNHVFLDSGLLRTFDQVDVDDLGAPEPAWMDSWFGGREVAPPVAIVDRVEALLASGDRPSRTALGSPYLQGALALHRARGAAQRPRPPSAWTRRRHNHGPLLGTAMHLGFEWAPPAVQRPVRRWWREHRPLG